MISTMSGPDDLTPFDIANLLGYRMSRLSAAIGQAADKVAGMLAGLGLP